VQLVLPRENRDPHPRAALYPTVRTRIAVSDAALLTPLTRTARPARVAYAYRYIYRAGQTVTINSWPQFCQILTDFPIFSLKESLVNWQ